MQYFDKNLYDSIEVGQQELVIHGVTQSTDDFDSMNPKTELDAGMEFLSVSLTVIQKGDEEFDTFGYLQFRLSDANGKYYEPVISEEIESSLDASLNKGDEVSGVLTFIAPIEGELFLEYTPEIAVGNNIRIGIRD